MGRKDGYIGKGRKGEGEEEGGRERKGRGPPLYKYLALLLRNRLRELETKFDSK